MKLRIVTLSILLLSELSSLMLQAQLPSQTHTLREIINTVLQDIPVPPHISQAKRRALESLKLSIVAILTPNATAIDILRLPAGSNPNAINPNVIIDAHQNLLLRLNNLDIAEKNNLIDLLNDRVLDYLLELSYIPRVAEYIKQFFHDEEHMQLQQPSIGIGQIMVPSAPPLPEYQTRPTAPLLEEHYLSQVPEILPKTAAPTSISPQEQELNTLINRIKAGGTIFQMLNLEPKATPKELASAYKNAVEKVEASNLTNPKELISILGQALKQYYEEYCTFAKTKVAQESIPSNPTLPMQPKVQPDMLVQPILGFTPVEQAKVGSGGSIHYRVGLNERSATLEQITARYRDLKKQIEEMPERTTPRETKNRWHNQLDQNYNTYLQSILPQDIIELAKHINTSNTIFGMLRLSRNASSAIVATSYARAQTRLSQSNHPDAYNLLGRLNQALEAYLETLPEPAQATLIGTAAQETQTIPVPTPIIAEFPQQQAQKLPSAFIQQPCAGGLTDAEISSILNEQSINIILQVRPGSAYSIYLDALNNLLNKFDQTDFINENIRQQVEQRLIIIINYLQKRAEEEAALSAEETANIDEETERLEKQAASRTTNSQKILSRSVPQLSTLEQQLKSSTAQIIPDPVAQEVHVIPTPKVTSAEFSGTCQITQFIPEYNQPARLDQPVTAVGAQNPDQVIKTIVDHHNSMQQLQSQIQEISRYHPSTEYSNTEQSKKRENLRTLQTLQRISPQELLNRAFGVPNIYKRVRAVDLNNLENIIAFARQTDLIQNDDQRKTIVSMLIELKQQIGLNEQP